MKRYLLLPGKVHSKTDSDTHFVGAMQLANLYGVLFRECVVDDGIERNRPVDLIHLRPRYDGKYRLDNGLPNLAQE